MKPRDKLNLSREYIIKSKEEIEKSLNVTHIDLNINLSKSGKKMIKCAKEGNITASLYYLETCQMNLIFSLIKSNDHKTLLTLKNKIPCIFNCIMFSIEHGSYSCLKLFLELDSDFQTNTDAYIAKSIYFRQPNCLDLLLDLSQVPTSKFDTYLGFAVCYNSIICAKALLIYPTFEKTQIKSYIVEFSFNENRTEISELLLADSRCPLIEYDLSSLLNSPHTKTKTKRVSSADFTNLIKYDKFYLDSEMIADLDDYLSLENMEIINQIVNHHMFIKIIKSSSDKEIEQMYPNLFSLVSEKTL